MMHEQDAPHRRAHTGGLITGNICTSFKNQTEGFPERLEKHYFCLDTLDMAAAFIRFFYWITCPDDTPLQILDGNAPIQFGLDMVSSLQFPAITGENKDGEWILDAHVLERGNIYPATFRIELNTGMVSYDKGAMVQDLSMYIPKWQITPFVKYLVEV